MKRIIIILAAIALLIIGFYAFNTYIYNEKQGEVPVVGENLEGEADPSRMTLGMTEWKWISSTEGGKEIRPLKEGIFALTFNNDGTFSAKTDCNSMGGSHKAEGGTISFTDIFSTKMYCEGSQEMLFSALLNKARTYEFTSRGELIFGLTGGGKAVFR